MGTQQEKLSKTLPPSTVLFVHLLCWFIVRGSSYATLARREIEQSGEHVVYVSKVMKETDLSCTSIALHIQEDPHV